MATTWSKLISPAPGIGSGSASPGPRERFRLLGLSFLMLFVELILIRWAGANIVYLSYFSNFILLGSFLGIGLGFLRPRIGRTNLFAFALPLLTILVAYVIRFPVQINRSGSAIIYFGISRPTGLPIWVTLPLIFLAVAVIMATLAAGVAETFSRFRPLEAYRLDLLGSIGGIVAFSILSVARTPPLAWGMVVCVAFAVLLGRSLRALQVAAILGLLVLLGIQSTASNVSWSPYYRVKVFPHDPTSIGVMVNGIPHQVITSAEKRRQTEPIYFVAYQRAPQLRLDDVLIVGAGTGTDVAIALSEGAHHVDAVEIDPEIHRLGKRYQQNHAYDDPRVRSHIDDGRAFIERTDQHYDLVIFALPDSLTLVSGQSSLRLESYLFTQEAMNRVRQLLKPQGVFAMYNFYREGWLVDRLGNTLQAAYGRAPCVESVGNWGHLAIFLASRNPETLSCPNTQRPSSYLTRPVTDDQPFLYLRQPGIPALYWRTLLLILAASCLAVWLVGDRLRGASQYGDLFFMGTAFLLLETKSVVQFALLFGTTWFVNALVFTGVLLAVLAAVEVDRRVRFRRPARLYAWLLGALGVAWAVPPGALLRFGPVPRFVLAVALSATPIFLANLAFAERFKVSARSTTAFGINLLGAMLGGVLEYSALAVGYRDLALLAAALYGLAFLLGRQHLRPRVPARTLG